MMRWTERYAGAKGAPDKEVEHTVYYSDFKRVGGLDLPHRIQRAAGPTPTEDITVGRIRINTTIDRERFGVAK
jgi:hypothetical protein